MQKGLFLFMMVCAVFAQAADRIWTGAGEDNKWSTPNNWEGGVVPTTGDTLVFSGSTQNTTFNDFDPSPAFTGIRFDNTNGPAFTLQGNPVRLSNDARIRPVKGTGTAFTEEIELDVESTGRLFIGTPNGGKHHLNFRGMVRKIGNPATAGQEIHTDTQSSTLVSFYGVVTNFSRVLRPNGGGGNVRLFAPTNFFTGGNLPNNGEMCNCEGHITFNDFSSVSGLSKFLGGQSQYDTKGYFHLSPTHDQESTAEWGANGPYQAQPGCTIENNMPGVTLTLSGKFRMAGTGKSTYAPDGGNGCAFAFDGPGNFLLTGEFPNKNLAIFKKGLGTTEIASPNYLSTGLVSVTKGTLIANTLFPQDLITSVNTDATLCGTGKIDTVILNGGTISPGDATAGGVMEITSAIHGNGSIQIRPGTNGSLSQIKANALDISGLITINLAECDYNTHIAQEGTCILKWTTRSGLGSFIAGAEIPSNVAIRERSDGLYVVRSTASLIWSGAVNTMWDTSTANWLDGLFFTDNATVTFPTSVQNGNTNIVIASDVSPLSVEITSDAGTDYTLSGAKITGSASFLKRGTSTLTLNNTNDYSEATMITAGTLELGGALINTPITIQKEANLIQHAGALITGTKNVTVIGTATLAGSNTFSGTFSLGDSTSAAKATVQASSALGTGDIVMTTGSRMVFSGKNILLPNPHWTIHRVAQQAFQVLDGTTTITGNITIVEKPVDCLFEAKGSSLLNIGSADNTNTVIATKEEERVYVRGSGRVNFYSRLQSNGALHKTDSVSIHLYAPSNTFSQCSINTGSIYTEVENAFGTESHNCSLYLGQIWENNAFTATFDLCGKNQKVGRLVMEKIIAISRQIITTPSPATLTITGKGGDTDLRSDGICSLQGPLSVRKLGTDAVLTLATTNNTTTGDWLLDEGTTVAEVAGAFGATTNISVGAAGTLKIEHAEALPSTKNCALRITEGGKILVKEGVSAKIHTAYFNGAQLSSGIYGGNESNAPQKRPDIFEDADGWTGTLEVLTSKETLLILR